MRGQRLQKPQRNKKRDIFGPQCTIWRNDDGAIFTH